MSSDPRITSKLPAEIEIIKAETRFRYAQCIQIRTRIFVFGQNVPAEREIDEYEDSCQHYLALADRRPVGTVRWRAYAADTGKIERLAVLEDVRGQGIGLRLMRHVLAEMSARAEFAHVRLASQDHAIPFYRAMGFEVIGDAFEDGGLPHHNMVLNLLAHSGTRRET